MQALRLGVAHLALVPFVAVTLAGCDWSPQKLAQLPTASRPTAHVGVKLGPLESHIH